MSVAWRSSSHAPLNVVDSVHYIASRSNANMSWISLEIPPGNLEICSVKFVDTLCYTMLGDFDIHLHGQGHYSCFVLQLEKKHDMLSGNGPLDLKRRNAVTNALTDLLGEKSGAESVLARECLYAIAPPELWQFYSAQGLSGSCKSSFYGRMIHLYKAVLVAVVTKTGKEKSAIVRAISEVLKTIHNRSGPCKYRMEHPDEVLRHSVGQKDQQGNLCVNFAKRSLAGKKRLTVTMSTSARESSRAADGGISDVHPDKSGRRNPSRDVQPSLLRMPSVEGSDEEQQHRRYDSDDSDADCDHHPPVVKKLFRDMM